MGVWVDVKRNTNFNCMIGIIVITLANDRI